MTAVGLLIEVDRRWYTLVDDRLCAIDLPDFADAIASRSAAVTWAVDSADCFFVSLGDDGEATPSSRPSRETLVYEMERHLPFDAESIAADFRLDGHPCGVALDAEQMAGRLDEITASGISVRSITPIAMMLAETWMANHSQTTFQMRWLRNERCDWIDVRDGQVANWKVFNRRSEAWQRFAAASGSPLVLVNGPEPEIDEADLQYAQPHDQSLPPVDVEDSEVDETTRSVSFEDLIRQWSANKSSSFHRFELLRGPLAPRDVWSTLGRTPSWAAAAAMWLIVVTITAASWRLHRIDSAAEAMRTEQIETFVENFPDQRRTSSPMRVVRSRYNQVIGSRRGNEVSQSSGVDDATRSAVVTLRRVLASLPQTRFQVERIDVRGYEVDFDVRVRSADDAYAIASDLAAAGFDVQPPATDQSSDGNFVATVSATWMAAEASRREGSGS